MSVILPHIDRMQVYPLGEQPAEGSSVIKLNQNENPYPPSPLVLEALRTVTEEEIRRYPGPGCSDLRRALAGRYGMEEEQVFCGNGSSEIISLVMKVFVGHRGTIALPDPSFSLYATAAEAYQAKCVHVPLREDFTVDTGKLSESGADAVILINPHAPTGLLMPLSEVERLAASFRGLLVIDEAYIDFSDVPDAYTAISLVKRYENVLVVRTFSKAYALCGARIGYCFAAGRLIGALEKGRDIYNVDAVSRKLAIAALGDRDYMERSAGAIRKTRESFASELRRLGFKVLPSQTNFVLCTVPDRDTGLTAERLCRLLMERNIYVRYYGHPRLADKLRISIGTDDEMDTLLRELRGLLV
jgi:histidinol-phosphate aminotransferase